jgi:protein TonB
MSETVMIFRDLPATFPEKDKYKEPSILGSLVVHGLLIGFLLILPFFFTEKIEQYELITTLVSPLGPPPAAPPPPVPVPLAATPQPVKPAVVPPANDALIMPAVVPKEVARLVDEPIAPASGVIGGVPGGVPGGIAGGVLGGVLAKNTRQEDFIPLPPPPPEPPRAIAATPIRVGGNIREPQIVKLVPPEYPPLASKARVGGLVLLEATLTAEGTVDAIRVISGHPLLIAAAIDCVKQWRYEPTYLNGQPVPVILTAKVRFYQRPIS